MIPLAERCSFSGAWPELVKPILLMVGDDVAGMERQFALEALDVDCAATGTFGSAQEDNGPTLSLPNTMMHLTKGDIISVYPDIGRLRVLFRSQSQHKDRKSTRLTSSH